MDVTIIVNEMAVTTTTTSYNAIDSLDFSVWVCMFDVFAFNFQRDGCVLLDSSLHNIVKFSCILHIQIYNKS